MERHLWLRLVYVVIILTLLVSTLTACGGGEKEDTGITSTPTVTDINVPNYSLTPLVSETLNPSQEDQTVAWKDIIAVTIPGGSLESQQVVTISSVSDAPKPLAEGKEQLAVYDISIGDQHDFEKDLTIEYSYDPAELRDDVPPEIALSAAYLDAQDNTWFAVPVTVDTSRNKIIIHTKHNGLWEWLKLKLTVTVQPTEYFYIAYKKAEFYAKDPDHPTLEELSTYPIGYTDLGLTDFYRLYEDVPRYIIDLGLSLDRAWDAYKDAGFRMPDSPIYVDVSKGWIMSADARNGWTGDIGIGYNNINGDQLANSCSHELFHAVQNKYYTTIGMQISVFGFLSGEWWFEPTAEYAAAKIARKKPFIMGITPDYFLLPFDSTTSVTKDLLSGLGLMEYDQIHPLRSAYFIDYLVNAKGVDFKEMFEYVADCMPMHNCLYNHVYEKTQEQLGQIYRQFAQYVIFNDASGFSTGSYTTGSQGAGEPGIVGPYQGQLKSEAMPADEHTKIYRNLYVAEGYSAQLIGIKPEVKSPQKSRALQVSLDNSPDYISIDIYQLDGDLRDPGKSHWIGSLERLGQVEKLDPITVRIKDGDGLYILITNQDTVSNKEVWITVSEVEMVTGDITGNTMHSSGTEMDYCSSQVSGTWELSGAGVNELKEVGLRSFGSLGFTVKPGVQYRLVIHAEAKLVEAEHAEEVNCCSDADCNHVAPCNRIIHWSEPTFNTAKPISGVGVTKQGDFPYTFSGSSGGITVDFSFNNKNERLQFYITFDVPYYYSFSPFAEFNKKDSGIGGLLFAVVTLYAAQ